MAPPVFAGFTLTDRLAIDAFGETWAASGPGGRRARVRRVDAKLAALRPFATAFLAYGDRLAAIEHPNIVATVAVGRDAEGALVAVNEWLENPSTLDRVLRDGRSSGVKPSMALAVHIARAVARALARAHRTGVIHGGVHPRSVLIDLKGEVKLGDFALAGALAAAASEDDSLLRGLLGYVAPELALGDAPDMRSDVFGAGALLHDLLTGSPPPGLVEAPAALVAVCERALRTDGGERYLDASAFSAALDAAAAQLPGPEPGAREVARFLTDARGAAERSLDAQTEDLLSDLIGDLDHPPEERTRSDATPLPKPMPGLERPSDRFPARRDTEADVPADLSADVPAAELPGEHGEEHEPTRALEPNFAGSVDIALDSRVTPLPGKPAVRISTADVIAEEAAPVSTPPAPTVPTRLGRPLPLPAFDAAAVAAPPAARPARAPSEPPRAEPPPRAPSPAPVPARATTPPPIASPTPSSARRPPLQSSLTGGTAAIPDLSPRGGRGLWIAALVGLVVVGVVIATKTDLLHPGRSAEHEREVQSKVDEAKRAAEVGRQRRADVVVDSDPPQAAVWMLLGSTPMDSLPLSSASIYELRVEQQGFKSADVVVTPGRWTGDGDSMRAVVRVPLEAAPAGYEPGAAPAEPPPAEAAAKSGKGQIHIDSEPPGAQVWLLVGFTPSVHVQNLAADRDYQFKVALDGYAPNFAVVKAADFIDPTGQTLPAVERQVTLKPRPGAKPAQK
jgi:serine/threonine-protein kinase